MTSTKQQINSPIDLILACIEFFAVLILVVPVLLPIKLFRIAIKILRTIEGNTRIQQWISIIILCAWILSVVLALITGVSPLVEEYYTNKGVETNLVTEAIGVVVSVLITVSIVDRLNERRNQERQMQDEKQRLIWEAGSRSHDVAIRAVEQLRRREWLTGDDGALKDAHLWDANLEGAHLWDANLQEADLIGANLQGTDLRWANLQEAHLEWAFLEGANLRRANLKGATLPDETKYTERTDLDRFTDPYHPNFDETLEKILSIRQEMGLED